MPKASAAPIVAIKPGISADGFRVAVRDYKEGDVVAELAANSYDADASTVVVLIDSESLHIVDDGKGFNLDAVKSVAVLGAGDKQSEFSKGKRPYLGCYGFGLKSTLNIAKKVEIHTISRDGEFFIFIDWMQLEQGLKGDSTGFQYRYSPGQGKKTGTHISLTLKTPASQDQLDQFASVLANLPDDDGKFNCYCGVYEAITKHIPRLANGHFSDLRSVSKKLCKCGTLTAPSTSLSADLRDCSIQEFPDRDDRTVRAKFFFGGIEDGKVRSLKPGLRGIYVRINGRLLKQSFTDQKYVYNISKWVKFAAGLRVEIEVDWLRNDISLSREGVRFSNPKVEELFRGLLTRLVSRFIQPQLKKLEQKTAKEAAQRYQQRLELARKRVEDQKSIRLPGVANGFGFKPETDGELALVLAQKNIMKQVNSGYRLIDYNDQAPFDCMIYDSGRREFIQAELEPTLVEFLGHRDTHDVQLLITWSRGKWRIGARKKGHGGVFVLNSEGGKSGHYKLLVFGSVKSKKPKRHFPVVVLEELMK